MRKRLILLAIGLAMLVGCTNQKEQEIIEEVVTQESTVEIEEVKEITPTEELADILDYERMLDEFGGLKISHIISDNLVYYIGKGYACEVDMYGNKLGHIDGETFEIVSTADGELCKAYIEIGDNSN